MGGALSSKNGQDNPLVQTLKILGRALRDMFKDELTTTSGRINLFGMIAALGACIIFGVKSLVEELAAGFRSVIHNVDAPDGDSALPYVYAFLVWTFACMIIGLVDRRSREKKRPQ